jgi:hypothetical protein
VEEAVQKRKTFHDFLNTVVESEASRNRYSYNIYYLYLQGSNTVTKDNQH